MGSTDADSFTSTPHVNYYVKASSRSDWTHATSPECSGIRFYYDATGPGTANVYWCYEDVLAAINKGGRWCTDCCGFIRLCLAIKGVSLGIYPTTETFSDMDTLKNSLKPGDLVVGKNSSGGNQHIMMVASINGNNVELYDQGGYSKNGYFSGTIEMYNGHASIKCTGASGEVDSGRAGHYEYFHCF